MGDYEGFFVMFEFFSIIWDFPDNIVYSCSVTPLSLISDRCTKYFLKSQGFFPSSDGLLAKIVLKIPIYELVISLETYPNQRGGKKTRFFRIFQHYPALGIMGTGFKRPIRSRISQNNDLDTITSAI